MKPYWCALASICLFTLVACGSSSSSPPPPVVHPPPPAVPHEWAWVSGSNSVDQTGSYGTQGASSASNHPGARAWPCAWTDASGNFWLFGGLGWASADTPVQKQNLDLNDLWKYSNGEWTWMGGSSQTEQPGVYGTMGTPAPGNVPGGRWEATCWTDASGNFWLYGGLGIDSQGMRGNLGDLWRYSNGEWTWMAGSRFAASLTTGSAWSGATVYGTEGVAAPGNTPGAREISSGWADASGNLWLFGGLGIVSAPGSVVLGNMNDLWKYSNGEWTWMAGSNQVNQDGVYGTLGTPAPGNTPGWHTGAATWTDASGNLWLFGGLGAGVPGPGENCNGCAMNDLWKYSNGMWTWMGGPDLPGDSGVYGTQSVAAPGNIPPPRNGATTWTDTAGNFWLFGGDLVFPYNDLWKYSNGQWTWVSGDNQQCEAGSYGTEGTPSPANVPGARVGAVGWTDKSGHLWLFGGDVINCAGYHSPDKFNDLWEYTP